MPKKRSPYPSFVSWSYIWRTAHFKRLTCRFQIVEATAKLINAKNNPAMETKTPEIFPVVPMVTSYRPEGLPLACLKACFCVTASEQHTQQIHELLVALPAMSWWAQTEWSPSLLASQACTCIEATHDHKLQCYQLLSIAHLSLRNQPKMMCASWTS